MDAEIGRAHNDSRPRISSHLPSPLARPIRVSMTAEENTRRQEMGDVIKFTACPLDRSGLGPRLGIYLSLVVEITCSIMWSA
jgi:hypothetical protein